MTGLAGDRSKGRVGVELRLDPAPCLRFPRLILARRPRKIMMTVSWRQAMRSISGAVRVVLAGTLMAGAASVVHGQPLKDVIAETLKTNPKVLSADAVRRAAAQDLSQARGGYFPTVDVNFGSGRERTSNPTSRASTGQDSVSLNRTDQGLLVTQNLFAGGSTVSEVDRQKARLDGANSKLAETREEVALKASEVYIDVLRNRELVRLASDNLRAHLEIR